MAFGLGRLALAPDAFWAMTPRELAAALGAFARPAAAAPGMSELRRLMADFPDPEEARDGG